jgi:rubrerythrin
MRRDRLLLAGGGVIVVVAVLVYAWNYRPANTADQPNGTWWICQNPSCKAEFNLTTKQISDWSRTHYGQPKHCPKCDGTDIIRAYKCPKCGTVYPATPETTQCPKCGAKAET